MFDFDVGKLLLIGVVALIFIPPKDLPQALRQLGRLLGQARRMATDFRAQFDEALREADLHELKGEFSALKQKASIEGTMSRIADMIDPEQAVKAQSATDQEPPQPAKLDPQAPQPAKIDLEAPQPAKIDPETPEKQMIEKAELPPVTTADKP
jgi:sec-independent protein translocase protein TatB